MKAFAALLKLNNIGKYEDELIQIYDQYSPGIYKYVLRLCHDQVVADNITGDVFAYLLEHYRSDSNPRTNLRSFLYRTAYEAVIDYISKKPQKTPLAATGKFYKDVFTPNQSEIDDRATMEALISAMNIDLTEDQRHVIILRFLEDFSIKETAEIMDKQIDDLKVVQNHAIVKLRKAMGIELEEDTDDWPEVFSSRLPGTQTTDAPPPSENKKKKKGKGK